MARIGGAPVLARARLPVALTLLLLGAGAVEPARADDAQKASDVALRSWGRTLGALGTVYGTPLLELSIAEYAQAQGLTGDLAGPAGLIAHADGGRLPTHTTRFLVPPDPDVLVSSAWLDVKQAPYVLWIPPLEGHWYSVQLVDQLGDGAGVLSSRTIGTVGGWYGIVHRDWQGERPPGVFDEIRVPTPRVWVLIRIAATKRDAAAFHERYQARFLLVPLEVYRRNPKAAAFVAPAPQRNAPEPVRALDGMRGTLDGFGVINQQLRRIEARPGDEALFALFDRGGFGPGVAFEPTKLARPLVEGLRDGAREGLLAVRDVRFADASGSAWSRTPPAPAAGGNDTLLHARAVLESPGASAPEEILAASARSDRDGRVLDGRNDYRIRFAAGRLPPAKAWTLAAYDPTTRQLLETGTHRYSLGSSTEGLVHGADGSLEIFVASGPPEDPARRANWLPVRTAPFFLIARLYGPEPGALAGSYALPPVAPSDD